MVATLTLAHNASLHVTEHRMQLCKHLEDTHVLTGNITVQKLVLAIQQI